MGLSVDVKGARAIGAGAVASCRHWTAEDFAVGKVEWSDLLERSDANPLFMSWEWMWLWWQQHAPILDSELWILAGYDTCGKLVGVAPFHFHRGQHRGVSAVRVESIGSCFRRRNEVFSEYLDIIADRQYADSFVRAVGEALLADSRWDDLVFSNTRMDSLAVRLVNECLGSMYIRSADPLVSQSVLLPKEFSEYLSTLDGDIRRRSWNQRRKLHQPRVRTLPASEIDAALDRLDAFHQARRGKPHYVGVRRTFHRLFAAEMAGKGALQMTELCQGDATLSVMYNVRLGDVEYNIQSGFDVASSKGLSPGYLHIGYALENACKAGIKEFDFLAGPGLHRDYKQDFSSIAIRLVTVHVVRSTPLAWLYKEYDRRFVPSLAVGIPSAGILIDEIWGVGFLTSLLQSL